GIGIFFNGILFFMISDTLPAAIQTPAFYMAMSFLIEMILVFCGNRASATFVSEQQQPGDESPSHYTCDDGHVVKSRGEALIDNWLYHQGIEHEYEKAIELSGKNRKFDWYLPDSDVYIEFWGYYGKEYHEKRKEKEAGYAAQGKKLVSITNSDLEDINTKVKKKLLDFIEESELAKPKRCFNCGAKLDDRYA
nr:hypothetical protein [Candidatus Sigynarchaeota archaeon]